MKTTDNFNHRERIYSLLIVLILLVSIVVAVHLFSERPALQPAAQWSPYKAASANVTIPAIEPVATVLSEQLQSREFPSGLDYAQLEAMIDAVSFTEAGEIALSENTRSQLERAVVAFGMDRTAQDVNAVHMAVADYLPPEKARLLSDFFSRYYAYKQAERDLLQGNESESLEDSIAHYEVINQLRRNYLGAEQADQLFQDEQDFMRITVQAMRDASP